MLVKNMTQEGGQDSGRKRPMSAGPLAMFLMVLIYWEEVVPRLEGVGIAAIFLAHELQ